MSANDNSQSLLNALAEIERLTAERDTLQVTIDEHRDLCVKRVAEITKERNALNAENERLTVALNRYSADEVRLTKESTIAAQQEQIERLTAEDKDFQILYEAQSVIIHTLTAERDAAYKKAWQSAAQLCHEMYMAQEYQTKVDYCLDDYAEGIAEGMNQCAKELAKKAKELTK